MSSLQEYEVRPFIPLVSIVMPVYNGISFLQKAIESILSQTYTHFELIIVNDCSTDGTLEYLYGLNDERIILVNLEKNVGVTGALQVGMNRVKGEYVARLDADDIAYPLRLEKQVSFMQQHPHVGLLGSFADTISMDGSLLTDGKRVEKSDIDLRWDLLFKNPFIHSTIMFRAKLITDFGLGYNLPHAEDYDLWARLSYVTKLALIPEPLIQYRVNPKSWTYVKASEQNHSEMLVSTREISRLVNASPETIERVRRWVRTGGHLPGYDFSVFVELIYAFLKLQSGSVTAEFKCRLRQLLRKRLGWRVVKERIYWRLFDKEAAIRIT